MTIHEIVELCGSGEQTVRDLINKVISPESVDISTKIGKARQTSKPAQFTLEETLAIIRADGKNTLADLLADNA